MSSRPVGVTVTVQESDVDPSEWFRFPTDLIVWLVLEDISVTQ